MFRSFLIRAAATVHRLGFVTLLLLCIGIYLIFPAAQTGAEIQQIRSEPLKITAYAPALVLPEKIYEIDGVSRASVVFTANGRLVLSNHNESFTFCGIDSAYLSSLPLTGSLYPDASNMPYLLLNKAAARLLSESDTGLLLQNCSLTLGDRDYPAAVCGIVDDSSEDPMCYLSCNVMYTLLADTISTDDNRCYWLEISDYMEKDDVLAQLTALGCSASADDSSDRGLDSCILTLKTYSGLIACFLLCGIALLLQQHRLELLQYHSEYRSLFFAGYSAFSVTCFFILRFGFALLCLILITAIAAALFETFTLRGLLFCSVIFLSLLLLFSVLITRHVKALSR